MATSGSPCGGDTRIGDELPRLAEWIARGR